MNCSQCGSEEVRMWPLDAQCLACGHCFPVEPVIGHTYPDMAAYVRACRDMEASHDGN